jgi:hypothetical protein
MHLTFPRQSGSVTSGGSALASDLLTPSRSEGRFRVENGVVSGPQGSLHLVTAGQSAHLRTRATCPGYNVSVSQIARHLPPSDADIRALLLERLRKRHGHESNVVFLEELGLCRGQVRVDLAVVNGSIHGYEIKSDRDSLRRLAGQAAVYGMVLDRATLVVGAKHVARAIGAIPDWWGVQVVARCRSGLQVKPLRRGRKNPARSARALVELLWLDDAEALLAARGGLRGFRRRPRRELWDRICALYGIEEIATAVREQLKARVDQKSSQPRV